MTKERKMVRESNIRKKLTVRKKKREREWE